TLTSSQTSLTFAEDSTLDLSAYLTAARDDAEDTGTPDADGSELYSYTVSGLPAGTIVNINGTDYTVGSTGEVTSAESDSFTAEPKITITPPADFSGDIGTVTITLNTRDTDSDSSGEIKPSTSSVTLDLRVTPVAGDVSASDVTTPEDTAVAFLAGVTVTDSGTTNGTELIESIPFELPTGWVVTQPAPSAGWSYDLSGTTATLTFADTLTQDQREAVLEGFTILPPAHSSL